MSDEQLQRQAAIAQTTALATNMHPSRIFRPEHFGDLTARERGVVVVVVAGQPEERPIAGLTRRAHLLSSTARIHRT
jgi:hypothetical protein